MIGFGVSLSLFLLQSPSSAAFVLPSSAGLVRSGPSLKSAHCQQLSNSRRRSTTVPPHRNGLTRRFASSGDDDEDDEDEDDDFDDDKGPLANGIDSVSWLPTVDGAKGDNMPIDSTTEGSEILPLFPLGGFVYTPNTEHVLNIFEPRYRQMYTDILMNGSKRFCVVTSHPTETGRFAKTGVLFELEDLKEVSEQTQDQIKYICNHKVTGRVTINKILNPEAWETRATYLKAEGTIHDDSGKNDEPKDEPIVNNPYGAVVAAATSKEENALRIIFKKTRGSAARTGGGRSVHKGGDVDACGKGRAGSGRTLANDSAVAELCGTEAHVAPERTATRIPRKVKGILEERKGLERR